MFSLALIVVEIACLGFNFSMQFPNVQHSQASNFHSISMGLAPLHSILQILIFAYCIYAIQSQGAY
jgi:hypothetical protein